MKRGKAKTSKSASKRFNITSSGKMMRRAVNGGHFNAKDNGNERQKRRGQSAVSSIDRKEMKSLLPYLPVA